MLVVLAVLTSLLWFRYDGDITPHKRLKKAARLQAIGCQGVLVARIGGIVDEIKRDVIPFFFTRNRPGCVQVKYSK